MYVSFTVHVLFVDRAKPISIGNTNKTDNIISANVVQWLLLKCLSKPVKLKFFFWCYKTIQMFAFSHYTCTSWSDSWFPSTWTHLFSLSNIHWQFVTVLIMCLAWKPFWQIVKVWIRTRYASKILQNYLVFNILWYQRAGYRINFTRYREFSQRFTWRQL